MIIQVPASKVLFLTDISSAVISGTRSPARFYQEFGSALRGHVFSQKLRALGNWLVAAAEHAHDLRQLGSLDQIRRAILDLPLPAAYKSVARYYEALRAHDFGRGDLDRAQRILQQVVDDGPGAYRARGLISLAAIAHRRADRGTAVFLYLEANRVAMRGPIFDPCGMLRSCKMMAAMSGMEGDHRRALAMLEGLLPLANAVRSSRPRAYFDFLNSLAVELMEANRLEEAQTVSNIVIASPFAPAYPEWRETNDDITIRRYRTPRSLVFMHRPAPTPGNLVRLGAWRRSHSPLAEEAEPSDFRQSARVLDYVNSSTRVRAEGERGVQGQALPEYMSWRQLMTRIMELTATEGLEEEDLRRIVQAIEEIVQERGVS
ncbi:MAG TPA: hypothetical protein VN345_03030 [Blastocatellia bacterium]|nr:hypothetical protein [Blastocatellia bacterium]